MNDSELRLECLKLASGAGARQNDVVVYAGELLAFVQGGAAPFCTEQHTTDRISNEHEKLDPDDTQAAQGFKAHEG